MLCKTLNKEFLKVACICSQYSRHLCKTNARLSPLFYLPFIPSLKKRVIFKELVGFGGRVVWSAGLIRGSIGFEAGWAPPIPLSLCSLHSVCVCKTNEAYYIIIIY